MCLSFMKWAPIVEFYVWMTSWDGNYLTSSWLHREGTYVDAEPLQNGRKVSSLYTIS